MPYRTTAIARTGEPRVKSAIPFRRSNYRHAAIHTPFDSPRWTEADARVVLAALARSGQSVRDFAERHELDPQRLYVWRRRVAGGDRTTFREVVVRATPSAAQGSDFEIALTTGVTIRVPSSFDAGALTRLLEVLERARSC